MRRPNRNGAPGQERPADTASTSADYTTIRELRARRRWLAHALLAGWLAPAYVATRVDQDISGGRP